VGGKERPGEVTRLRNRRYCARVRLRAIAKMGGRCMRCGFSDHRALQFDHVKPLRRGLSGMSRKEQSSRWTHLQILKGAKGYQLLCANCHTIKTRTEDDRDGTLCINWAHSSVLRERLQMPAVDAETSSQLEFFDGQV
jgi:5-methylcytosine-specific restriction endonuclease McrA